MGLRYEGLYECEMTSRRRRRAAALCALGATHAARYCPVASNGTSARDRCVGRELELQIWNDAGRAVVVHRVDARGREHTGIFLAPGAVVRRLGCEGTLWRARRTEGLPSRGRVIAERYQGAETGDDVVEALVASVSDQALDAKHGDAGGERWRVGACDALPQTATYFSSYDARVRRRGDAQQRDKPLRRHASWKPFNVAARQTAKSAPASCASTANRGAGSRRRGKPLLSSLRPRRAAPAEPMDGFPDYDHPVTNGTSSIDAELQAKWDEEIRVREAKEAEVLATNLAEAKAALEAFEEEREVKMRASMQTNREKEQVLMEQLAAEGEGENPWERIVSLVDLQASTSDENMDTSRMRQVFIQLKNNPPASP